MTMLFAAVHKSASGPKRRFAATQQSVAFGGKADMARPSEIGRS